MNDLRPGFVRMNYSTPSGEHKHTFQVKPTGTLVFGAGNELLTRSGGVVPVETGVVAYAQEYRKCLSNTATITTAEYWSWLVGEPAPVFRHAFEINLTGTLAFAATPAMQVTMTWRTSGGGYGKTVWLDAPFVANLRFLPPLFGASVSLQAWNTYIQAASSILRGRDDTLPIAAIKALSKTNDALRKRYNLV